MGERKEPKKRKKEEKENEERRCKAIIRFPFFSIRGLAEKLLGMMTSALINYGVL